VNSACIAAYANIDPAHSWQCFMAQYSSWYINTPLFVSNSLYDSWQAANIMGLGCDPTKAGSCSAAQMAYLQVCDTQRAAPRAACVNSFSVYFCVQNYHNLMIQNLQPILSNPQNGAFLQSCFVHVSATFFRMISSWPACVHKCSRAHLCLQSPFLFHFLPLLLYLFYAGCGRCRCVVEPDPRWLADAGPNC
jgi:hypothetical protein